MPRQGKRYICLDWNFYVDADADGLTHAATSLFVRALINCAQRESDGLISRSTLAQLGGNGYHHSLKLLLRSGRIVEKDKDVFYIPSWHKWNKPIESVYARRAADRQRKRIKNGTPRGAFRMPD